MDYSKMTSYVDHIAKIATMRCRDIRKVKELEGNKAYIDKFREIHGIDDCGDGLGFSESEQKWYGWTDDIIIGFGVGDVSFGTGDEGVSFVDGDRIVNIEDAKDSAKMFVAYARDKQE